MRARAAVYPLPVSGHHPNFRGAGAAADLLVAHLIDSETVRPGDTVLSYPDYVLRPVRKRLLEAGADLLVPAKYGRGYRLLKSGLVAPHASSSIAGAERQGILLEELGEVRLVLVACVAFDGEGHWLSKGYGFQLPERVRRLASATIVHPLQQVASLPVYDGRVTFMATPDKVSNLSASRR